MNSRPSLLVIRVSCCMCGGRQSGFAGETCKGKQEKCCAVALIECEKVIMVSDSSWFSSDSNL